MLLEKLFIPVGACLQMTAADFTPEGVVVDLRTTAESADCPSCSMRAQRVHSHSQRRLADLPLAHTPVRVQLHLRRFRCDTLDCSRTTFSEPIAALAKPYARRTARLQAEQRQISLDVGAEPGARLARRQGMPVSPDTLLRLARREPPDVLSTPRHLGIDDFALRKGQVYGTILVDLQAHRPVDLLEQRSAEVVEQWLKAHPGVEVITRDRSNDYAEGASRGAPDAVQVADRFHLLTNLREMLQRLLDGQQQALAQATREPCSEPEDALAPAAQPSLPEEEKAVALLASACVSQARLEPQAHEPTPLPQLSKAAECSQRRRERRYERYTAVRELREQGLSLRAIAAHLGVSRRTVRQFASAEQFPERASRPAVRSKLDPFSAYLSQQLAAGEDNAMQLWRELGEQGYSGSRALVSRWVAQHRQLVPKPDVTVAHKRGRGRPPAPVSAPPPAAQRRLSARKAAWLLVRRGDELEAEEQQVVQRLCHHAPSVDTAYHLAQDFIRMVRQRQAEKFEAWLLQAAASGIPELVSFVAGLERDKAAVVAALSLPFSNGQVEGQVNRLKLIKRCMYGRAKFDLLRRRVLARSS